MDFASGALITSAVFWGPAVGVIAIVVSTVAIMWVTDRVGIPKRRLLYSMPVVTPLLNSRSDLPQDIEVRRAGKVLTTPQVVNIEITGKGRLDIARDAFDGAESLPFNIDVTIVECLKVATVPSNRRDPTWRIEGSTLLIGPSLIGRRQSTIFTLLVDGESPALAAPPQLLRDVEIRPRDPAPDTRLWDHIVVMLGAIIVALMAGIIFTAVDDIFIGFIASFPTLVVGYVAYTSLLQWTRKKQGTR